MIEYVVLLLIGVVLGTFTGLTPGIHTNLLVVFLLSLSQTILDIVSLEALMIFIVSMSITHTFLSTIPSIYLGAPEPGTSVSILPGHKMLLDGKGYEAVKLTILGSLLSVIISFFLYPVFTSIISFLYTSLQSYIGHLLIVVSFFLILRNEKKWWSALLFILTGLVGFIVLESNMKEPLFPMLTGLFGISTLVFSLKGDTTFPSQTITSSIDVEEKQTWSNSFLGTIAGFITCILPGLGSSTAAVICSLIKKENDVKYFLIMIGSITTVNFFMSLGAAEVIQKARNGSVVGLLSLHQILPYDILLFTAVIASGVSGLIALYLAKYMIRVVTNIDYRFLVKSLIFFLLLLVYVLTGFTGMYVVLLSFLLGYMTNVLGVSRNVMMASIIVPVATFFLT